jgi:Protein of unknown function (DUF3309)
MRLILIIILLVLLFGGLPTWPYSSGWGYYPSRGLFEPMLSPQFKSYYNRGVHSARFCSYEIEHKG